MDERALNAEIERAARSLHERWESPELLDRIHAGLAAGGERGDDAARPVFREEDDSDYRGARVLEFRRRVSQVLSVAAAIAFLVGLGALAALLMGRTSETASYDRWVLEEAALREVETSERAYVNSIERLEALVEPQLRAGSSPLALSYREKLLLLDQAIAECEAEIATNRRNTHVRKQLLSMYTEKQRTLQQLVQENLNVQ
jgi:hypothetical protein